MNVTALITDILCNTYKWDEGYIGDVLTDLMENTQTDRDDNKNNNKITELRAILQRESQNS